jgi:succinyl-diaminopimelate desuccinylase
MSARPMIVDRLASAADRDRLLDTALRLVAVSSPTGGAGAAADALADLLREHGLPVVRVEAGHPDAPAVVVRLHSGKPGPTLQFDGHLDVVHLPFVPPRVEGNLLRGSGAADMKGGLAAAVEAVLALRDAGLPTRGAVLLTAHDLHEAPWGFGAQLDALIDAGHVGDAVLIPEPLSDVLPVRGRGQAVWAAAVRRDGAPVHEVMRDPEAPDVLAASAALLERLGALDRALAGQHDPVAGRSSVFVGQIHGGSLYNQSTNICWLEGTRRWVPGRARAEAEGELRALVAQVALATRTTIDLDFRLIRDAFALDPDAPIVRAFHAARAALGDVPLVSGPKPFVDDGNSFSARAGIPAITHGPRAGGQHTTEEWADIDDLIRVARTYALTAALYLGET